MCDHFNQQDLLKKHIAGLPSRKPYHEALLLLFEAQNDPSLKEDALRACRAVDVMGSEGPDILVLLHHWVLAADWHEESIACARLARAFAVDSSSVNPLSFILLNEASGYFNLCDYNRCLPSGQEALRVAREAKPEIHMRTVANLALLFSGMGYRSMFQADLDRAQRNNPPPNVRDRLLIVDLIEATEAFRIDEANRILERLSQDCQAPAYPTAIGHEMQVMLQIYVSMFPGQKPDRPYTPFDSSSVSPDDREECAMIRTICDHLHNRRSKEALDAVYGMIRLRGERCFTTPGLTGYYLVRAELANGNLNAARRALNARKDTGLKTALDGFFDARIALLQQDPEGAHVLFRQCLADMDALKARNRLLFELALSSEIPLPVLLEWGGLLKGPAFRKKPPAKQATFPVDLSRYESGSQAKSNVSQRLIRHAGPGVSRLVGHSREMEDVRQFIERMARQHVPVLLTGQTGTGKDVVARAIHEESSRTAYPFMAINCASLGENLLSSELFGHERGAFTGASEKHQGLIRAAGKGTLFLDEIGEISSNMQAALLRVLETGEFRPVGSTKILSMKCRIIAATNQDLAQEVRKGRFRKDLFYRLRRLEIQLSPLSRRKEDILPLSHFFFNYDRIGSERVRLHADLEAALTAYAWPGNIRELRNTIERIRLFHGDKTEYGLDDLLDVMPDWDDGVPPAQAVGPQSKSADLPPVSAQDASRPATPSNVSERSPFRIEEAVLHLFKKYGRLTRKEVIAALQISPNTATKYMTGLIDAGHIEKVSPSRSPRSDYYRLIERPEERRS